MSEEHEHKAEERACYNGVPYVEVCSCGATRSCAGKAGEEKGEWHVCALCTRNLKKYVELEKTGGDR